MENAKIIADILESGLKKTGSLEPRKAYSLCLDIVYSIARQTDAPMSDLMDGIEEYFSRKKL